MNASLLDMLHDSRYVDIFAVAQRIDVDLGRSGKVAVEQDRAVAGHIDSSGDIALEAWHIADNLHRATAEHI